MASLIGRAADPDTWPGDTRRVEFLWENAHAQNEITDQRTGDLRVFRGTLHGRAWYGPNWEMILGRGAFRPQGCDETLFHACKETNELTVECVFRTDHLRQGGPSRIISFSSNTSARNFTLGQDGDELVFRLRTPRTGSNGSKPQTAIAKIEAGRLYHALVTYRAPGALHGYLDGERVLAKETQFGDFANWEPQRLIFGDEHGGGRDWSGSLERVAIYSRFVEQQEAKQHHRLATAGFAERKTPTRVVIDGRLVEAVDTPVPASIAPYRRCFAEYAYAVERVVKGEFSPKRVLVGHWVIMDGEALRDRRDPGAVYRLQIEPWDEHGQLSTERRVTYEGEDLDLPLFFDAGMEIEKLSGADEIQKPTVASGKSRRRDGAVPDDLSWLRDLCQDGALGYHGDGKAYLVELGTGKTEVLGNASGAVEFSPDSSKVAWIDGSTAKGRMRKSDRTVHTIAGNVDAEAGVHWHGNDAVLVLLRDGKRTKGWRKVRLTGRMEPVPALTKIAHRGRETDVKQAADGVWSYVAGRTWKTGEGKSGNIGGGCSCSLSPDALSITALQGGHKECKLNAIRAGGHQGVLKWQYSGSFDNHRWSSNDARFLVCVEETENTMVVIHRDTCRATRMGLRHKGKREMYGDFTVGDGKGAPWPKATTAGR